MANLGDRLVANVRVQSYKVLRDGDGRINNSESVDLGWFGPDYPENEVTPEVASHITNPKAWEGGEVPVFDDEDLDEDDATVEPRGNASTDTWRAHAEALGIDVPDDAGRDDIRALVAAKRSEQD